MKKIGLLVISFITALYFSGCGNELLNEVNRVHADPFSETPTAVSFSQEGLVKVSWSHDPGADFYILERREDGSAAITECYRGTKNHFEEKLDSLNYGKIFLYSLKKVRGNKIFGPFGAAIGVGENSRVDTYEPNNTVETATFMDREMEGSLFYYRASSGEILQDEDWFYLELAPRTRIHIKIYQRDLGDVPTAFFFNRLGESAFPVTGGADYTPRPAKDIALSR
jgi:hypothetical protein